MSYCPCCGCMSCNYERQRIDKEIKDAGGPDAYFKAAMTAWWAKFSVPKEKK